MSLKNKHHKIPLPRHSDAPVGGLLLYVVCFKLTLVFIVTFLLSNYNLFLSNDINTRRLVFNGAELTSVNSVDVLVRF